MPKDRKGWKEWFDGMGSRPPPRMLLSEDFYRDLLETQGYSPEKIEELVKEAKAETESGEQKLLELLKQQEPPEL